MQDEMVLQKLNELREAVDGDMEEMVDAMANMVVLRQDISNPMYGAQVTFYEKPDGRWVEIDEEDFPVDTEEYPPDKSSLDNPWAWRAIKEEGRWYSDRDDDEVWYKYKRYLIWGDKVEVDHDDLPDEFDPEQPMSDDIDEAEELQERWDIYETNGERVYRRTPLRDPEGLLEHKAIVFEPSVADAPEGRYWDPHEKEYMTPNDYPMGTVNLVIPEKEGEVFGDDYVCDVRVETSVTPADGEPSPNTYTPGW